MFDNAYNLRIILFNIFIFCNIWIELFLKLLFKSILWVRHVEQKTHILKWSLKTYIEVDNLLNICIFQTKNSQIKAIESIHTYSLNKIFKLSEWPTMVIVKMGELVGVCGLSIN